MNADTDISRRDFLDRLARAAATPLVGGQTASDNKLMDVRTYLSQLIYTRQEIDDWFAGKAFPFAKYDGELGWLLRPGQVRDGVDDSTSIYTFGKYDERQMVRYANHPCRINTYGDSFTQCHQVSDGETWQEGLAAHLGEPVRNYGVGGYSVYQAYLRMRREEKRTPAPFIVFNIFIDDHYRNIEGWRNFRIRKHPRFIEPTLPYLIVDGVTGEVKPQPNPCPTQKDFYHLADLDWVERRFRDDFVLRILLAHANAKEANPERAYQLLMDLAKTHGINTQLDASRTASAVAEELHRRAAMLSTMKVVEWIEDFCQQQGKKILYVLSFSPKVVARAIQEGIRPDHDFVEFMRRKRLPYIDLLEAHAAEFKQFNISVEDYLKRYYIGHYNPQGNAFTAWAIKPKLVEMLNPKPPAYRSN